MLCCCCVCVATVLRIDLLCWQKILRLKLDEQLIRLLQEMYISQLLSIVPLHLDCHLCQIAILLRRHLDHSSKLQRPVC